MHVVYRVMSAKARKVRPQTLAATAPSSRFAHRSRVKVWKMEG